MPHRAPSPTADFPTTGWSSTASMRCLREWYTGALPTARAVALGVGAFLLAGPLLALAHEALVILVAELLGSLGDLARSGGALRALPLDPIYTGALLLTLGGIDVRGIAVAEPVGGMAEALWPAVFEPADLVATGAWASAVVAPGATIVSRWAATLVADAVVLALGVLAVRAGVRRRLWLAVVGAIVQAQVIVTHLIDAPPDLVELEAAGIPFAIAMIVSGDVQAGPRIAEALDALPPGVRDAILGAGMVGLAYMPMLLVLGALPLARGLRAGIGGARPRTRLDAALPRHPGPGAAARARLAPSAPARRTHGVPGRLLTRLAPIALAGVVAASPLGDYADAQTHFLSVADGASPAEMGLLTGSLEAVPSRDVGMAALAAGERTTGHAGGSATAAATPRESPPIATLAGPAPVPPGERRVEAAAPPASGTSGLLPSGPSTVAVAGGEYRYTYTVNGVPQQIRGMGYNVQYRDLPPEERARRIDRDFALLRRAGVNTVFGWEPREFDGVLLDAAQRHGLGVAPPFELDPDAEYADPAIRASIEAEVVAWIERYRAHPALRMWAIGNEVLHKLVYPSWMPIRSDPEWEERARAFAAFYATLLDRVHALDPDHPVVYRDAEDAYLSWMRDELARGPRRPWFVYGINAYTPRLAEILATWPAQGFDVPLFVSEFAPGGMSPTDRSQGFRSMWAAIRGAETYVLGGSVYAWTTDGPEEVDRVFGLTDGDGRPVDGALTAVAGLFRGAEGPAERAAPETGAPPEERVRGLARRTIEAIQAGAGADVLAPEASASILGDLLSVPTDPVIDGDVQIVRDADPRRVAWSQGEGVTGEWWVTWAPADRPDDKLMFLVRERSGGELTIHYIYHGPR